MMQLYGFPASRASRSPWALEEIGIECENTPRHCVGDTKEPQHLAVNPK